MTHADFTDIPIKAEPLSPESSHRCLVDIVSPYSNNTACHQQQQWSPKPDDHSNNTHSPIMSACSTTAYSTPEHYSTAFSYSPMMSSGAVKTSTGLGNQPLPSGSTRSQSTPSTSATCTALKSSILNKRRARGEVTPLTTTDDVPREYKLTKRELERKEARKEQNRRAARRCRMKKKRMQNLASQEMKNAIKENVDMKNEVQTLRQQVNHLQQIISEHEKNKKCMLDPFRSTHQTGKVHFKTQKMRVQLEPEAGSLQPLVDVKPSITEACHTTHSLDTIAQELLPNAHSNYPDISALSEGLPNMCGNSFSNAIPPSTSSPMTGHSNNFVNFPTSSTTPMATDIDDQDIDEIINTLLESDGELALCENSNDSESRATHLYPRMEGSPDCRINIKNGNADSKPPVVRNLSKYFMQTGSHSNFEEKVNRVCTENNIHVSHSVHERCPFPSGTPAQSSRFLQHTNLSSPVLNCVAPNLVQQPLHSSPSDINNSPSLRGVPSHKVQNLPLLENQIAHQCSTNATFPSEMMGENLNVFALPDAETILSQSAPISSFSPYFSCPVPAPGATLTNLPPTTNAQIHTIPDSFSAVHGSPGEFIYELSPISTPSPSSSSTISSPGLLHQESPRDLCLPYSDTASFNTTESVLDFNH